MESISDKAMYDKVAANIRDNLENISKHLASCEILSTVANEEQKITDFLTIDAEKLIEDQPKSDYYDLKEVSTLWELLEVSKPELKRRHLKSGFVNRSESMSSLVSTTCQSIEDISQLSDVNIKDIDEIRNIIETISNTRLNVPDLNFIKNKETSANAKFVDLVMNLQKLAKELNSIASSDTTLKENNTTVGSQLINDLQRLSAVRHKNHLILYCIIIHQC